MRVALSTAPIASAFGVADGQESFPDLRADPGDRPSPLTHRIHVLVNAAAALPAAWSPSVFDGQAAGLLVPALFLTGGALLLLGVLAGGGPAGETPSEPKRRPRASLRERVLVVASAVALAVLLTWPLAAKFAIAGRIDSGDGRFSVWNVAWVARALTTDPSQLYHANIFHPHENTLAFSELNLLAGVLAIPVWAATGNAIAANNWVTLCSFVLAFIAMYALVRRLTGNWPAAAFSAVHFAYAPYVLAHIPHVQLLMTFGLPLVLLALHRFVEAPSAARALALGATLALQGLASAYYGIFGGLVVVLGAVWFGVTGGHWRSARYWLLAGTGGLFALLLVLPFFLPYLPVREAGFVRTLDNARLFSATWLTYFVSAMWLHGWLLDIVRRFGDWREVLFPGFLPIAFATVTAMRLVGGRAAPFAPIPRATAGFYLVLAGAACWASFGPAAGLYTVLYETIPLFAWLRAPERFGLLVTMALAIVGGAGFGALQQALVPATRRVVVGAVLAFSVMGSTVGGLRLAEIDPTPAAYTRLAAMPRGPVAEFPFWVTARDRHRHTEYMLWSTRHWQPLINGYSDFIPPQMFADMQRLATFPSREAWQVLRERSARYVLVHWHMMSNAEKHAMQKALGPDLRFLRVVVERDDVTLYEVIWRPTPES